MAVTFIDQQTQAHSLRLKNKRISENYRFLKEKMAETAALRHEFRHQLTAMDCLCQKDDMEGMRQLLTRMMQEQADQTPVFFTKNHTINTILQVFRCRRTGKAAESFLPGFCLHPGRTAHSGSGSVHAAVEHAGQCSGRRSQSFP